MSRPVIGLLRLCFVLFLLADSQARAQGVAAGGQAAVDAAIANEGKARLLARFHDFCGWDAHAL